MPGGVGGAALRGVPLSRSILPENLTWRETAAPLSICKIDRIFGAIRIGRLVRPSWPGRLPKGTADVRLRFSGVA
jgi:hypothetical protein